MDFKVFYENQIISEVFLKGKDRAEEGDIVIALGKNIWLINDDNFEENIDELSSDLGIKEIPSDIYDLKRNIEEEMPDVLIGTIDSGRTLHIDQINWRHQNSSVVLKKVQKALNLTRIEVSYINQSSDDETVEQKIGDSKFYHGTSLASLQKMATGLRPMPTSNFDNVVHIDKVFVTMNIEKAYFHAMNAATKQNSFPVIIELRIPDESKLVMDYDVAVDMYGHEDEETYKLGYTNIAIKTGYLRSDKLKDIKRRLGDKKKDLSMRLGVFGYKGRIPASFFDAVIFDDNAFPQAIQAEEYGESFGEIEFEPLSSWDRSSIPEFKQRKSEIEDEIANQFQDEEDEE